MQPQAVLFDLDGVLIDSMPIHYRAWQQAFGAVGITTVTGHEVYEREGEAYEKTARELYWAHAGSEPAAEIVRRVVDDQQRHYRESFELVVVAGAVALLGRLQRDGVRLALVTGSRLLPQALRARDELIGAFDVVVTGSETLRGKPAPDPYLRGLELLGDVDPDACLVVENAPLGVRAAVAANLACVAVLNSSPLPAERLRRAGAQAVFRTLAEVDRALSPPSAGSPRSAPPA
jgi:HAD superfamily hydrolase (TIGR01509 family)